MDTAGLAGEDTQHTHDRMAPDQTFICLSPDIRFFGFDPVVSEQIGSVRRLPIELVQVVSALHVRYAEGH